MHKVQSMIAAIELNSHACWEVLFKPNTIVSLEDIVRIYHYIERHPTANPVLMDWRMIQGIEFEALEHIARMQKENHPLAIVSEAGSIGEKYGNLIVQLIEHKSCCSIFNSMFEARSWMTHAMQVEA